METQDMIGNTNDSNSTYGKLAPRPPKASFNRAIYDVIKQVGPCDERTVHEYLPIVLQDQTLPPKVTHARLSRLLYNCVYNGYLVFLERKDGKRQWREYRIAPLEYFNQRKAHRDALMAGKPSMGEVNDDSITDLCSDPVDERPSGWQRGEVPALVAIFGFLFGLAVGFYLGINMP